MKRICFLFLLMLLSLLCEAKDSISVIIEVDEDDFTEAQAVTLGTYVKNGIFLANNKYKDY